MGLAARRTTAAEQMIKRSITY